MTTTLASQTANADFLRFETEYSAVMAGKTPVIVTNMFARFTGPGDQLVTVEHLRLAEGAVQFVHRDFESELSYSTEFGSWAPNQAPASAQIDSFLAVGSGPGQSSAPIGALDGWPLDLGFAIAQPPFAVPGSTVGYYPTNVVIINESARLLLGRFVTTLDSSAVFTARVTWKRPNETNFRSALGGFALSPTGDDLCPDNPERTYPGYCGCDAPSTDSDADGAEDCWDSLSGVTTTIRWERQTPDGGDIPSVSGPIAVAPHLIAVGVRTAQREVGNQGGVAIALEFDASAQNAGDERWTATRLLTDPISPPNAFLGASVSAFVTESGAEVVVGGSDPRILATPVAMPVVVWSRNVGQTEFEIIDRISPIGSAPASFAFGRALAATVLPGVGEDIFVAGDERVFVYRRLIGATQWTLHQTILPPSGSRPIFFAESLRFINGTLSIGTKVGEFPELTKAFVFYRIESSAPTANWTLQSSVQPPIGASITSFHAIPAAGRSITSPSREEWGRTRAELTFVEPSSEGGAGELLSELSQPLVQPLNGYADTSSSFGLAGFGDVVAANGTTGTYIYRRDLADHWEPFMFLPNPSGYTLAFGDIVQSFTAPATDTLAANGIRTTPIAYGNCNSEGAGDPDADRDGLHDCVDPDDDGDGIDDPVDLREDLNNDGKVDGSDLTVLLANWGLAGISDINADGVTDGNDVALLFQAWTN
jgi:hypothetical protein